MLKTNILSVNLCKPPLLSVSFANICSPHDKMICDCSLTANVLPTINEIIEISKYKLLVLNKIIVFALHLNPWVEASAGGLLVPEGLYKPSS
jgi:hypothetical protein